MMQKSSEKIKLIETFITSQFGHYPPTWIFCGRKANSRTNHLHERALRIVYKSRDLSFDNLLKIDGCFTIYHSNIQTLSIEIFKIKNGSSSESCELSCELQLKNPN